MEPVSKTLLQTARELQQLPSLQDLILGGGTNLAIRYHHRLSDDIDLFYPGIIGQERFDKIMSEVKDLYKGKVIWAGYPTHLDEQMMFGRINIVHKDLGLKVEILHNSHAYETADIIDGVRLMSERDIGLLKLTTASNRANYKDIYDLDYITDKIPLTELMSALKVKLATFDQPYHKTVFDLDYPGNNPIVNPQSLLKFENPTKQKDSKPGHSSLRLDIIEGSKNWNAARSSWRGKVRQYFRTIGEPFPKISPFERDDDRNNGFTR